MKKNTLFLLKADFEDPAQPGKQFVCPECVFIEGLLSFYPRLRESLEVTYVDFKRPRQEVIQLLGEQNQSCPVLVTQELPEGDWVDELAIDQHENLHFVTGQEDIARFLVHYYKIGQLH